MSFAVILLTLAPQAPPPPLQVAPRVVAVGGDFVVSARAGTRPAAGVVVALEHADGSREAVGATDLAGELHLRPKHVGYHVVAAEIEGVRHVVAVVVEPPSRNWLLAFGTVPLALALGWRALLSRPRDRRGS